MLASSSPLSLQTISWDQLPEEILLEIVQLVRATSRMDPLLSQYDLALGASNSSQEELSRCSKSLCESKAIKSEWLERWSNLAKVSSDGPHLSAWSSYPATDSNRLTDFQSLACVDRRLYKLCRPLLWKASRSLVQKST